MEENNQEQKPTTKKKLTKKQEVFVSVMAKTGDPTNSALMAFDTENKEVARQIGKEYLQKPPIMEAITEKRRTLKQALIDRGIDEDRIAEKIDVLLDATDKDGNEDYTAIDKGLKHATLIHGVVDPGDGQKTQNVYNFIFSPEGQEKVKVIEAEIKDALTKRQLQ